MLVFVKVIHTLVWGVMAASTFYAIYAGLGALAVALNRIERLV
jgi:hypothetical protein